MKVCQRIYATYTPIVRKHHKMQLEFSLLRLNKGESFESSIPYERAFLLMSGEVDFAFNGKIQRAQRTSLFQDAPLALQVPQNLKVKITALSDRAELALEFKENPKDFPPVFYDKNTVRQEIFGRKTLHGCSKRLVRTIFDYNNAPFSSMVLGEVLNLPGRWSSFPPHEHEQPEVYHYRFSRPEGFGFGAIEKDVFYLEDTDTLCIPGWKTHPQTSAPGFAMYYIWMIPHLVNNPFGKDSRIFREEHEYLNRHLGDDDLNLESL